MRLGFDLDEVIVNLTKEFETYIESNYGIEWSIDCFVHYDFSECRFHENEDFNNRIAKDMLEMANDPDFQFKASPIKDSVKVLHELKKCGHKIYIITARPSRNQPHTFKWLRENNIPFDKLHVIGHNEPKGLYGRKHNLDMYVDDLQNHLESMYRYKKKWRKGLLLFDKPWNSDSVGGSKFVRVKDWKSILRHVGVPNR